MSIKLITLVWDKFDAAGSELLCLLALADFANDQGGSIHPSIKTLATKIRASESQARRVLHKLINDGFVSVVGNHDGGAPGMTRRYEINVAKLKALPDVGETGSVDATPSMGATGSMGARDGSHGCAETGSMGATQTVIEPSENRQTRSRRKGASFDPLTLELPSSIPAEVWAEWIAYRRSRRLSMAEKTAKAQIANLDKWAAEGYCPAKIIGMSIANGWQGLFQRDDAKSGVGHGSSLAKADFGTNGQGGVFKL